MWTLRSPQHRQKFLSLQSVKISDATELLFEVIESQLEFNNEGTIFNEDGAYNNVSENRTCCNSSYLMITLAINLWRTIDFFVVYTPELAKEQISKNH